MILAGCQSSWQKSWQQPIPDVEIVYQSNVFVKPYTLGFVQADGTHAAMLEIAERLVKPVWSQDATILYGLSVSSVPYFGYPAYWDTGAGKFKFCNINMPYFDQIEGADDLNNPYEVVIQHVWTIVLYDLSKCEQVQVLVDYSDHPGDFSINGFSYFQPTNELIYGLVTDPDRPTRDYHIIKLDLGSGEQVQLAKGINPAWSPDGKRIAYLGLNGLYVMQADGGGSYPVLSQPFFDPWTSGNSVTPLLRWSTDGEWLVYHVCGDKICQLENIGIYKIRSTGGAAEKVIHGGMYPAWKP